MSLNIDDKKLINTFAGLVLLSAIHQGSSAWHQFLKLGVDIHGQSDAFVRHYSMGGCALIIATPQGNDLDTVKALLEYGASTEVVDDYQDTPLIIAIRRKNIHMIRELIQAGCNINHQNIVGHTPLMEACIRSDLVDVVALLLQRGANTELRDQNGLTAFLKACGNGLKDIASLLVQHDADILAVNNEGEDAMAILQSKIWLDDRPTYQRTLQYIHDLKHDILLTQQLMEFTTSFLDEDEDRA